MATKDEIKKEVIEELNEFCKTHFEKMEMSTEGSLTDIYYYMALKNVNKALDLCFESTYKKVLEDS